MVVGPVVVVSESERRRPEGVGTPTTSRTRALTPSLAWTVRAPIRIGPHVWYGDAASHGSGRETRYGTAIPYTSSALAVLPPDDAKYSVDATLPPYSTTWPAVAVTAAEVRGFSPATPR